MARRIPTKSDQKRLHEIRDAIFSKLTQYDFRPVEMSAYISLEDYDRHEEKHAYYVEMMDRMISIFNASRSRFPSKCRLLELGPGPAFLQSVLL